MSTLMNACADGEYLSQSNLATVTTVEMGSEVFSHSCV